MATISPQNQNRVKHKSLALLKKNKNKKQNPKNTHFHLSKGAGGGGAHTLGSANTFQPSSWPILTRAAIMPMYAQAAAPIP